MSVNAQTRLSEKYLVATMLPRLTGFTVSNSPVLTPGGMVTKVGPGALFMTFIIVTLTIGSRGKAWVVLEW